MPIQGAVQELIRLHPTDGEKTILPTYLETTAEHWQEKITHTVTQMTAKE